MTESRTESAVDGCEREIRRWIVGGSIPPGDRLPPERALAAQLGVNRTTLRSALTRLATARLLRVRQGSGYVVQDFRKVAGLDLLPDIASSEAVPLAHIAAELLGVRRALVRMALEEIAERGAPSNPDQVAQAVERFGNLVEASAATEELAVADHEIAAALLSCIRSPVLALSLNPTLLAVRTTPALCEAFYHDPHDHLVVAWMLARWVERPSEAALPALLARIERRDQAVVTFLSGEPADAAPVMEVDSAE